MGNLLQLLGNDIYMLSRSITVFDWMRYALYTCWFIMVALPLKGIDRRDPTTALVYILSISAGAMFLLVALPDTVDDERNKDYSVFIFTLVAIVAAVRWFFNSSVEHDTDVTMETKGKEKANGQGNNRSGEDKAA